MNDNSLIKDIGRSYIVSSFLPAVLFVSVGFLIFRGFAPEIVVLRVGEKNVFYASQMFLFFALTSWLAFGLYSAANSTIRFFEGYYLHPKTSHFLASRMQAKLKKKRENINPVLKVIENKRLGDEISDKDLLDFAARREQAKYDYLQLETISPIDEDQILPTRLGNILRASELYPAEKYSVPGVMLWPRLLQLLPKDLKDQLEEKNNQMVFTLNTALLSYIIGATSIGVALIRLLDQTLNENYGYSLLGSNNFFARGFTNISPSEYIGIGILFLTAGYFAYCLSIPIVENFGLLVRTSYDLYRFELLRKLNHPLPGSIQEEKTFWDKISEYMIAGDRLGFQPVDINYSVRKELLDYKLPKKPRTTRRKKRK